MYGKVITAAICGAESQMVTVEADVSDGMPLFSMIGFLASEVREAQDRVRTALKNAGIHLPAKRITVNLAPADLRKSGSAFDLAISVSILAALGIVDDDRIDGCMMIGELSLNGSLCKVRGVMEMISRADSYGCSSCIVPMENLAEGSVTGDVCCLGADSLLEVISFLNGENCLQQLAVDIDGIRRRQEQTLLPDFADLKGQNALRRAAEIAVSGLHNLLIIGPPGSGKTMTARRLPSILPCTTLQEAMEISRIHSIAGDLPEQDGLMTIRPFRSPHHTTTIAAMAGGGISPRPGEVSLAHRGVLFLDELPEFRPETLETLRQPLEEGFIQISRLAGMYRFPADFMLCAAMNPCKCGYYPDRNRCKCSERDVRRYLDHISQPLLDRIDLCVEAREMKYEDLKSNASGENSSSIRSRVEKARTVQQRRYEGTPFHYNSDLDTEAAGRFCSLGPPEDALMRSAFERLHLTGRSYVGILKVARTIADLDDSLSISCEHLSEAISFRSLDKRYWGRGDHGEACY